jgi:hypothetical protein
MLMHKHNNQRTPKYFVVEILVRIPTYPSCVLMVSFISKYWMKGNDFRKQTLSNSGGMPMLGFSPNICGREIYHGAKS